MHLFDASTEPHDIERAIEAGEHFWLDIAPARFAADHPVARAIGIDDVALARIDRRAGRPGAIVSDGSSAITFAGAIRRGDRVERVPVVVLAGPTGLVTLRDQPCERLDDLKRRPHDVDAISILDTLTDSMREIAEALDGEVEDAETAVIGARPRVWLKHVTTLRQQVSELLKIAREQLGMVERNQEELEELPVRYGSAETRIRDLVGHLVRATDTASSTRQTIAEALNLYLSIAAENLTRVATVLLPLTVVSGFFGMNFTWMVDHIDTFWSFAVFGIGGMLLAVAGVRLYLRRKGYA